MKNFLSLIIIIFAVGFSYQTIRPTVVTGCQDGFQYALSLIPDDFDLSQEKALIVSTEAAEIWNQAIGREVITYQPNSEFLIDFIFDDRQQGTIARIESEQSLDSLRAQLDQSSANVEQLKSQFAAAETKYNADRKKYQSAQAAYNSEVENRSTSNQELEAKRKDLEDWYQKLENDRIKLNALASNLNNVADQANKLVESFNQKVINFNNSYEGGEVFRQGVYNGSAIEVYQYENDEDLRALLVHEFGHALGIDHVEDPMAVMYYLQHEDQKSRIDLTEDDIQAMNQVCEETWWSKIDLSKLFN